MLRFLSEHCLDQSPLIDATCGDYDVDAELFGLSLAESVLLPHLQPYR